MTPHSKPHSFQCTDCKGEFTCYQAHDPRTHDLRRAQGWKDRCAPCKGVAKERFYKTLPPLTRGIRPQPRTCPSCGEVQGNCACGWTQHERDNMPGRF